MNVYIHFAPFETNYVFNACNEEWFFSKTFSSCNELKCFHNPQRRTMADINASTSCRNICLRFFISAVLLKRGACCISRTDKEVVALVCNHSFVPDCSIRINGPRKSIAISCQRNDILFIWLILISSLKHCDDSRTARVHALCFCTFLNFATLYLAYASPRGWQRLRTIVSNKNNNRNETLASIST